MTKFLLEPETEFRLRGIEEVVELCDHSGKLMGFFHPVKDSQKTQRLRDLSPFTDEEILARCEQTGGRPLADILRDLERS